MKRRLWGRRSACRRASARCKAPLYALSLTIALLLLIPAVSAQPSTAPNDPIVRAMRDEITRSLKPTTHA